MEIIPIILLLPILVVIVAILVCYHNVLTTCFFKHSYVKLMSEIFFLLLTILSIFYSIHADIFSDEDFHDNILTYPINQIERNDSEYCQEIKYIVYDDSIKEESVNFVFVIDRTLSGQEKKDPNYQEKKDSLLVETKESILRTNSSFIEISDILLYNLVKSKKSKSPYC